MATAQAKDLTVEIATHISGLVCGDSGGKRPIEQERDKRGEFADKVHAGRVVARDWKDIWTC